MLIDGLLLLGGLPINRADAIPLGLRQVGLGTASLIGRKSVGEGPRLNLSDAALDAVLPSQRKGDRSRQVAAQSFIAKARNRAMPSGGVKSVTITDQIASTRGACLGAPNLGRGRLLVQLHQQDTDRDASSERQHPEQDQSRTERMQSQPALLKPLLFRER